MVKQFNILVKSILGLIVFFACNVESKKISENINYPKISPIQSETIKYNDTLVDDYAFLETENPEKIKDWISSQNKLSDSIINSIKNFDSIKKLVGETVYSSNERGGFPKVVGNKIYYIRILLKENVQKIMYREDVNSADIELFNTKTLNTPEKEYNIDYIEPSYNGKYLLFGYSINGDEMTFINIIDIATKKVLPDVVERCTYAYPMWHPKKDGFFYAQLKEIKGESDKETMYENSCVKFHILGKPVSNDKIIFSSKLNKSLGIVDIDLSAFCIYPNTDKVFCFVNRGSSRYKSIFYTSLLEIDKANNYSELNWNRLTNEDDKSHIFTYNKEKVYTMSFNKNTNGEILMYDLTKKNLMPVTIYEAKNEVLESMLMTNNALYLESLKNGSSSFLLLDTVTLSFKEIELPFKCNLSFKPPFGNASTFSPSDKLYLAFDSWSHEAAVYVFDPKTKLFTKTNLRKQGKFGNLNDIEVREIEVASHDGTKIPLSIVYKKGLKLDGSNPTILQAYGAYGTSLNTGFYLPNIAWLNLGGVFATAHVRGGGEKGDTWYKAGFKDTKPNSWLDFIACSEYLIKEKYTSPEKLAAKGISAGGLTIGRAITERPELYKAAIIEVGLLNSLKVENMNNTFIMSEFGDSKTEMGYRNLYNMDVIQHIKKDVTYPSLIITGGLNDARVDWWMPTKAAIKFQQNAKDNIVLFKLNDGGHGGLSDVVKEESEYMSFLMWRFNQKRK